jgi:hypothetical protein
VIGGQHIAKAIKDRFIDKLDEGYKLKNIPLYLSHVVASVMKLETPLLIARLAAGEHQRVQQNSVAPNTEDTINMFCKAIISRMARIGTGYLDEHELRLLVESMGILQAGDTVCDWGSLNQS